MGKCFTPTIRGSRKKGIFFVGYQGNSPTANDPNLQGIIQATVKDSNSVGLREWKDLCVSIDIPIKKPNDPLTQIFNQRLSPSYTNPVMWTQYAEKHQGACLVFDMKKLNTTIYQELSTQCIIFHGRVSYRFTKEFAASPIVFIDQDNFDSIRIARSHYFTYYKNIFFRKHPSWKYENEYRWLLYSTNDAPEFVSIQDSIKAIFVGIDFPKDKEAKLAELSRELNIPAGRLDWENGIAFPRFGSIYEP